jgi:ketosteroid isomerase-like protein
MQFPSNADLVAHVQTQLNEMLFGAPDDTKEDIARHFSPEFVQIINGDRHEYDDFIAHVRHIRETLASGRIEVQEAVQNGDIIADRHTMTATDYDGKQFAGATYAFVQLGNDGRIVRINEITQIHAADDASRNPPYDQPF